MRKIVIIGASGYVGSAILKEALSRGHEVKSIVRDHSKITLQNPKMSLVCGDIMDTGFLTREISGTDAVISAYNPGWKNPHIFRDTLEGYSSIIGAARKARIPRLLLVGGAGSLEVSPGKRLMDEDDVPRHLLPGIRSLAQVYNDYLLSEKVLDWVFFSPAANLTPGERTGKFRLGKDSLITDDAGASTISVEDYAMAMIDELEQANHHQERFTIGY